MISKIFYSIDEALARLDGDKQMFFELVEFHGLRLYAKFDSEKVEHMDGDSFFEDTLCCSGKHDLATWYYYEGRPKTEIADEREPYYRVSGWLELSTKDSTKVLMKGATENPMMSSFKSGHRYGEFWGSTARISASSAFLKVDEVEKFRGQIKKSEAPTLSRPAQRMRSDREQSLMRVIAGLWALSDLPTEHNSTADKLSALFDGWGWDKPAAGTIADTILREAANLPGAVIRK